MKTIAFSIKGLLTAVTMIAVGLFALMNATYVWSSVVLSFTLLLLLIALVAIVYRRGESRAFWVGFAIFGWGYFILTNPPLGESYQSSLPTHLALGMLHESVSAVAEIVDEKQIRRLAIDRVERQRLEDRLQLRRPIFANLPSGLYFLRIGHCLWAWLFALIGGFLARHLYLAQERSQAASEGASQPAGGR